MFLSRLFGRGPRAHAPAAEAKASRTAAVIAWQGVGRPVWTPRDYAALAREGYQRNPVVHRAVRMVAEAAAGVTLVAFDGEREVSDHPVLGLLARPNPRDGGAALLQALYGHLLVSGNAYLERVDLGGVPRELHALRPDRVRVVPGPDGWAQAWDYTAGGRSVRLETPPDGPAPVLHLALFHPLDDHYGLSPMEAAAAALDVHNAAGAWNKALLDNAARPSGALVYAGPAGASMGEEQFQRLKAELEAGFQGPANAGRPLLLEGGLDWKPLSLSPRDMDFVEAKAAAAREIALAFGVPPMLLGLPGDNTYANFAEANRSFWRQTVLPLAARTAQSLAHWLGPAWPGDLRLEPDLDRIEALTAERGELWARVGTAEFLTRDEKRTAVGYGAEGGGLSPMQKYSPDQPRVASGQHGGCQWTRVGGGDQSPETDSLAGDVLQLVANFTKEELAMSVQEFISANCLGIVNRRMPSQFLDMTVGDILLLAERNDKAARTCKKLIERGIPKMNRPELKSIYDIVEFCDYLDKLKIRYHIRNAGDGSIVVQIFWPYERIEVSFYKENVDYTIFSGDEGCEEDFESLFIKISSKI